MTDRESNEPRRYLLIDDDPDDSEIFCIALEEVDQSIQCATVKNGVEALEKLHNQNLKPEIIFLDLNMPLMHGKECLKELKSKPATKDIPVVMYTTSSYSKDIADTQELGAAHFLIKPASMGELVHLLSVLLQGKQTTFVVKSE